MQLFSAGLGAPYKPLRDNESLTISTSVIEGVDYRTLKSVVMCNS